MTSSDSGLKFRSILYFYTAVIISIDFYLFMIFNVELNALIIILQIVAEIIIFIGFKNIENPLNNIKNFSHFTQILNSDSDWETVKVKWNLIKSKEIFPQVMTLFFVALLILLFSLILNIFSGQNLVCYANPIVFLIIAFWIRREIEKFPRSITEIDNWITKNSVALKANYIYLQNLQVENIESLFSQVSKEFNELTVVAQNFYDLSTKKVIIKNIVKLQTFFKQDLDTIIEPIKGIYHVRGMLGTLMSAILRARELFITNAQKMKQYQHHEYLKNDLDLIDKQKIKLVELKNSLETDIATKISELTSRKAELEQLKIEFDRRELEIKQSLEMQIQNIRITWDQKLSDMQSKVDEKFDANFNRFKELDNSLHDNYTKLVSNSTQLYFDRFYAELLKERLDPNFFENFIYLADRFFEEKLKELSGSDLEAILEKLAEIHDNITTP